MPRRREGTAYEHPKKGSGKWRARITLRSGRHYSEAVPPHPSGRPITQRLALAYARRLQADYDAGVFDPEAAAAAPPSSALPTLLEYLEEWEPKQTYAGAGEVRRALTLWLTGTELGGMRLDEIRRKHVRAWVDWLRTQPKKGPALRGQQAERLAPRTVRLHFEYLHRVLNRAVDDELLEANPAKLPRGALPPNVDAVPGARALWKLRVAAVEKLISDPRIPTFWRVLWAILFLGAQRIGEGVALRWADYDPETTPLGTLSTARAIEERTGREKGTKKDIPRLVPVHRTLAAVLAEWKLSGFEAYMGRRPEADDYLVPRKAGGTIIRRTAAAALKRHCAKLGITVIRLHGTRHTAASLYRNAGADKDKVRRWTHGSRGDVLEGYTTYEWEALSAEVEKLKVTRRQEAEVVELPRVMVGSGGSGNAPGSAPGSAPEGGVRGPGGLSVKGSGKTAALCIDPEAPGVPQGFPVIPEPSPAPPSPTPANHPLPGAGLAPQRSVSEEQLLGLLARGAASLRAEGGLYLALELAELAELAG